MYKMTNESGQTEILLYSLIEGGSTAGSILKQLRNTGDSPITLRINSDGGEVFDAIALYNYLKEKNVAVIIDGVCASAASLVAMSGQSVTMKQGSLMMIHNPVTLAFGDSEDLKGAAEVLDKVRDQAAGIYEARTGMSHEEVTALMSAETWMTPEEALAKGFIDRIDPPAPEPESPALEVSDRYEEGVLAERERLQALDELMTPERAPILNAAKYQTYQSAQEIAVSLLKAERPRNDVLNSLPLADKGTGAPDTITQIINRIRRI